LAAIPTILVTTARRACRAATNTPPPNLRTRHDQISAHHDPRQFAGGQHRLLRGARHEIRRRPDEKGRYTNVFLAAPGGEAAPLELTYNWDPEPYTGGCNFGHLAYPVDNIYDTCNAFIARGVTINRPPRDGRMAFIRTPDGISIELLQAGGALPPAEPWTSCPTPALGRTGSPLVRSSLGTAEFYHPAPGQLGRHSASIATMTKSAH
jgi:lactoylglutathione lyase